MARFKHRRRKKTPVVLQMEAVECGAAALGSILSRYGKHVPLSELREQCGVNRDGSRASNIIKAARRHGMEAKGYQRPPEEVFKQGDFPVIAFWRYSHFLVVEGGGGDAIWLNDPSYGHRRVTREEFIRDYSGIVLKLAPGPDFQKSGRKFSALTGLRERFKGEYGGFFLVLFLSLLLVLPTLAIPVFSKIFVDNILVGGQIDWVIPLLTCMLLALVLRYTITWMQQHYILKMRTKLTLTSSSTFMWHVLRLPAQFFSQRFAPEITQRAQLNEVLANLLSASFATTALNFFLAFWYLLAMFLFDWPLALFAAAIVLMNVFVVRAAGPKRRDEFLRMAQERGKVDAAVMASMQAMETVKAQGMEDDVFEFWAGFHSGAVNSAQKMGSVTNVMNLAPVFLAGINNVMILGVGAMRVMDDAMTLGGLVAFQILAGMLLEPVNQLSAFGGALQDASAVMTRLDDVLQHPPEEEAGALRLDDETVLMETTHVNGELEFRDVTFGYSPLDAPLLENFSMTLRPGARVALVGGSGSGKSTLAKLGAGLYKPWSGEVLVDGAPRKDYAPFVLRNSIQMVDQDIVLFEGTVRDNLTLWNPTVRDDDLIRALEDACLYDVVTSLPGGLDSRLSENARNLSGGQRQCLEIARALVCNPSVLILDEAYNSLDPIKERRIDFNLRRRGCTCLIVAHRLSTVRDADEIIVLENGRVLQRGVHEDLIEQPGLYRELIVTQGT